MLLNDLLLYCFYLKDLFIQANKLKNIIGLLIRINQALNKSNIR